MSKLNELKDIINLMLDDCDKYDYPRVCDMASTPETRKHLEDEIVNMAKQGIGIRETLNQIERAHNSNMMDD